MTKKKTKKAPAKPKLSKAVSKGMRDYWARKRLAEKEAVTQSSKTVRASTGLSGAEINSVIATCAEKGVLSFQYGDLQLMFKKSLDEPKTERVQRATGRDNTLSDLEGASRVEERQQLQEASDVVTEELEHLKITDPAAYEEFIQSEDADDGDGGHQ